jgi:aspartate kinase
MSERNFEDHEINRVSKLGGTSMVQPTVAAEQLAHPGNEAEVVVVSAPAGLTDMLHRYEARSQQIPAQPESIQARVAEVAASCDPNGTNETIQEVVGGVPTDLDRWERDGSPRMGLGENWMARIFAAYTGREFVDARHVVRFNDDGTLNRDNTYRAAQAELRGGQYVVPGFYGSDSEGRIHLLERNGSDITGALLADVLSANRFDVWSDVPGFMTANPREVAAARLVPELTGREVREMYPGCVLLHRDVIRFTGRAGIPVHLRHTFGEPDNVGSIVTTRRDGLDMPVVGVVGMDDMVNFDVYEFGTEEQSGRMADVFNSLAEQNIPFEDISTHVDGMSVLLEGQYRDKLAYPGYFSSGSRQVNISPAQILRVVGEVFARSGNERSDVAARAAAALGRAGIDFSGWTGAPGAVSRTFILEKDQDMRQAVNAVHAELFDA